MASKKRDVQVKFKKGDMVVFWPNNRQIRDFKLIQSNGFEVPIIGEKYIIRNTSHNGTFVFLQGIYRDKEYKRCGMDEQGFIVTAFKLHVLDYEEFEIFYDIEIEEEA